MVIVRLIGGLGNQLFQYALGRHIAEIHKTILKIDISAFETYKLHKYTLWPFNIRENFATPEEVKALTERRQGAFERLMARIVRRPPRPAPTYIQERELFCFDPDILNLPDGVYLEGSWQNDKYFKDIEEVIRREFTVKTPQEGRNLELAGQIGECDSVSLHIRRGTYLKPPYSEVHGTMKLEYYLRCVESLTQRVEEPHFFIFSDDSEWARDNLRLSYPATLVDHNDDKKDYEDLRLMSQCKHNIIANSTFSWWGAWLNRNPEKLVFAPKRWLRSDAYNTKDLMPNEWIIV
jgi:hypothetical protein